MPKLVISRATELGASRVEVMQVALDPHAIRDACRVPVKVQRVPVRTGQDNPRIGSLFDDAVRSYGTQKNNIILFYRTRVKKISLK